MDKKYFPFLHLKKKKLRQNNLLDNLLFNKRSINLLGSVLHNTLSDFPVQQLNIENALGQTEIVK